MELTAAERVELISTTQTEGFKVVLKLMEAECDTFRVLLDNADPANEKDVLAKHILRKAAAMFVTQVIQRINQEIAVFAPKPGTVFEDITESLIEEPWQNRL